MCGSGRNSEFEIEQEEEVFEKPRTCSSPAEHHRTLSYA